METTFTFSPFLADHWLRFCDSTYKPVIERMMEFKGISIQVMKELLGFQLQILSLVRESETLS